MRRGGNEGCNLKDHPVSGTAGLNECMIRVCAQYLRFECTVRGEVPGTISLSLSREKAGQVGRTLNQAFGSVLDYARLPDIAI
jgi:hypothetical protein